MAAPQESAVVVPLFPAELRDFSAPLETHRADFLSASVAYLRHQRQRNANDVADTAHVLLEATTEQVQDIVGLNVRLGGRAALVSALLWSEQAERQQSLYEATYSEHFRLPAVHQNLTTKVVRHALSSTGNAHWPLSVFEYTLSSDVEVLHDIVKQRASDPNYGEVMTAWELLRYIFQRRRRTANKPGSGNSRAISLISALIELSFWSSA